MTDDRDQRVRVTVTFDPPTDVVAGEIAPEEFVRSCLTGSRCRTFITRRRMEVCRD